MSRRTSQSQASIDQQPNVNKASGVCSRCLAVRQLHLKDGTVHLHGPRNSPCPGSRQPPLSSTSVSAAGTEEPQQPVDGGAVGTAQPDPTNGAYTACASSGNDRLQHP